MAATSTSRPATPPLSRTASFSNVQQYPPDSKYPGQPDVEARETLLEAREEGAADARLQEMNKPSQGNPSGILAIAAYCGASIMMTVVNKFVVSGHHFSMTFLLLTIQSVVCVSLVYVAKKMRVIDFRDFDMKDAKIWFPISALLVSVIYTGSKSLQYLSIPVYTIFKNLTIILIAYGEVIWFGGHVTSLTLVAFALMVGSSIVAAWSDISTSLNAMASVVEAVDPVTGAEIPFVPKSMLGSINGGYFWMASNCIFSAAYVLAMRKRIKLTGFKDWDSMFYNNLLCIPILVVASVLLEDWGSENLNLNFPAEARGFLLFAMAFSGAAAVFISYSTAWCIRTTSSTTYSMVGALNKLPVAASGMIFFGDPVNFGSVSAVGTGFIAGLVYAIAKQSQSKADKARQATQTFQMREKA
ncbi:hypothetical protein NliqN6_6586 [Naganishia liquefaciens]|uniref:GDP-mannose transporter n=1 Tax=Naganishia liquefaciens TaxID=104408 RepID=A0A8H3U1P3_9TREE|nr:hypothetical protein NliqN6_6586 [Naganishia liquefaciens]